MSKKPKVKETKEEDVRPSSLKKGESEQITLLKEMRDLLMDIKNK